MKQNNDIPDKIMERIRKLMRLKESTTSEGEARETALTCCHDALIDKYLEKITAAGEVCRLYEVHPADLSVDGRCACRKVPGKVPGTETDYITIQTLLEYASNDI